MNVVFFYFNLTKLLNKKLNRIKRPFIYYNKFVIIILKYRILEYRLISKKGEGTFSEVLQA